MITAWQRLRSEDRSASPHGVGVPSHAALGTGGPGTRRRWWRFRAVEATGPASGEGMSVRPPADGCDPRGDDQLISAVRRGDGEAYRVLYERHRAAAGAFAKSLVRPPVEADDIVAEAFTNVLATLRAGRGPHTGFRPYLMVTLRHLVYRWTGRHRGVEFVENTRLPDLEASPADTTDAVAERMLLAEAFMGLPEQWQWVLWETAVERRSVAQLARERGVGANRIAALAFRARQGLRRAYLQAHAPAS
jgi:RNA polymerase sigma factor (sigma-70 family)